MTSIKIGSIISSTISNGIRKLKLTVLGKNDVQEIEQIAPHGIDSCPPSDTRVLHVETLQRGACMVVGSINDNQLAVEGEIRLYSTNADGTLQTYVHLLEDGTIEVGGTVDNMVRYAPMADSVNEIKDDSNNLKDLISSWTPVPNDGGLALKTLLTSWAASLIVEDISASKIDEIKTL
jgi:hypothetical protein